MTSKPAGSHRPGLPSSASTRRQTDVPATAASVSTRDASARAAACAGVNGGVSLVLTRPGTGSFAITTTCAARGRLDPAGGRPEAAGGPLNHAGDPLEAAGG